MKTSKYVLISAVSPANTWAAKGIILEQGHGLHLTFHDPSLHERCFFALNAGFKPQAWEDRKPPTGAHARGEVGDTIKQCPGSKFTLIPACDAIAPLVCTQ